MSKYLHSLLNILTLLAATYSNIRLNLKPISLFLFKQYFVTSLNWLVFELNNRTHRNFPKLTVKLCPPQKIVMSQLAP